MREARRRRTPGCQQALTYVVLPPGLDGLGLISGRWASLVLGDELAARIDELAVRLVVAVD